MLVASQSSYDPAPLQWLRGEIELSLSKARENLDMVHDNPSDAKAVQAASAELHQVTGALLMVGLDAAARLNEEAEKLVETLKGDSPADASSRVQIVKNSTMSLSKYLDSLVAGKPDRPMELAASYVMLNKARGANDASASDLFTPDLNAAAPDQAHVMLHAVHDDEAVEAINRCRAIFQAGLLKLVRDKDLAGGARHMRDAAMALEALDATLPSRPFWFTTVGFLDAVAHDPAGAGSLALQSFGKIDQQIKRLIQGEHIVPEKLFRDLLLVIGRSAARTERISQIRETYRLDELLSLPSPSSHGKVDKRLVPVVDALRDHIRNLKDDLQSFSAGSPTALGPLTKQAAAIATVGQQLPNREMVRLLQLFGAIGRHLGKSNSRLTEVQALEIATALLFVESSLEDYFNLTVEFEQQAKSISTRIQNAMTGVELPGSSQSVASLSDTMSLQAQTHLLVFQVGREVQANLVMIESALDDFFRDSAKSGGLATAENLFKQVRGALSMLEENEAATLAGMLGDCVAEFAIGAIKGEGEQATLVAEGVSALGLYIGAIQQGSPDARERLLPALVSFGIAKKAAPVKKLRAKAPVVKAVSDVEKPVAAATLMAEAFPIVQPISLVEAKPESKVELQLEAAPAPIETPKVAAEEAALAFPVLSADSGSSITADDIERLTQSEAGLKTALEERDQRIRKLQAQMVALHKEAQKVAALKAELKELRTALANAEKKVH